MTGKKISLYILAAFIAGTVLLIYIQYNSSKNIDSLVTGNQNLIDAARAAGSPKIVAQTVAWELPDGPDSRAVKQLESSVLAEGGVVLSYGQFYGPGTYNPDALPVRPRVHIDVAASRTARALSAPSGIITITD